MGRNISHTFPFPLMSNRQPEMNDIYDLVELNQKLTADARTVRPEQKKRFVELADQAIQGHWAEKYMGGEDIELSIKDNREKFAKYLAA